MALSGRSRAALIGCLATMGHSDISVLAVELDLDGKATGANRIDRVLALLRALEEQRTEDEFTKVLLALAERMLAELSYQTDDESLAQTLTRALQTDGFALADGHLLPAGPGAIPIQDQVSALEAELSGPYPTALVHYRQAVDNFVAANHEAANGQLRSCLESFFIVLCTLRTGKTFGDASAALQHLRGVGWLDDGEWNHFRHFWADIQDNGPHHGLSSSDEALFRLHFGTAVIRYLIHKH